MTGLQQELRRISQPIPTPNMVIGCLEEFVVENNDWGAKDQFGEIVPHKQTIFSSFDKHDGVGICGWEWQYPELPEGRVLGYPEVIYGKKPWSTTSTTTKLPKELSASVGLEVSFGIRSEGTGVYNTAFDLWVTTGKAAGPDFRREVMVWLSRQGDCQPAGGQVAEDALYRIYYGLTAEGVPVTTYVSKELLTDGILPLGLLLRDAMERKLLPQDAWLASVELGNEVWCGKGAAIVDSLEYRGL